MGPNFMGYNRPWAKAQAKEAMRNTYPHPMLVTLVYLLLTSVLTYLVSSLVADPFSTFYWYVVDGAYQIEDLLRTLLTPRSVTAYLSIQLLISVYGWIMDFGYTSYALRMARGEQPGYRNLLDGFLAIGRAILVSLLISIFTTLWGMLAMVPAFVVMFLGGWFSSTLLVFLGVLLMFAGLAVAVMISYRYRLAVYLLLDNPSMGALASITESKRAMMGWKAELFVQDLSFFGWYLLLGVVSGLVGTFAALLLPWAAGLMSTLSNAAFSLWLTPYVWGAEANFYDWVTHGHYSYQAPGGPDGGYQSPYSNF